MGRPTRLTERCGQWVGVLVATLEPERRYGQGAGRVGPRRTWLRRSCLPLTAALPQPCGRPTRFRSRSSSNRGRRPQSGLWRSGPARRVGGESTGALSRRGGLTGEAPDRLDAGEHRSRIWHHRRRLREFPAPDPYQGGTYALRPRPAAMSCAVRPRRASTSVRSPSATPRPVPGPASPATAGPPLRLRRSSIARPGTWPGASGGRRPAALA